MNSKRPTHADASDPSSPPAPSGASRREVLLKVLLETFDLYVRSVAEITAETGISRELTVETLMAYGLALPAADELIHGFIRGDLTLFPPAEQNRQLVDRDTRRLELEPPMPECRPATRLGRKLEPRPAGGDPCPPPERSSDLEKFIKDNPEIFRQVRASSHEFLVRWVMLHLLEAAQARQRVHRIAHEFWAQFPGVRQQIEARAARQSPIRAQPPQTSLLKQRAPLERRGIRLP
jgi:hypothetical protein